MGDRRRGDRPGRHRYRRLHVLHNITTSQLQSQMGLNFTSQVNSNGTVTGTAYYLPQAFVKNTLAAFGIAGTLDPTAPYLGPFDEAGQLCDRIFIYGAWLSKWDVSVVKRTPIKERFNVEFRVPGAQRLQPSQHPQPRRSPQQRL